MALYLLMGDIHLSDRPPSSCTETYLDDLFTILRNTVTLATTHNAAGVIWAGDIFHHKTPSRTTHATTLRLIELARAYPCPVYVVPGNHDMQHDRLASLDETQPLGVVIASGAVQLLDGWSTTSTDQIYGVPWQMTWDDQTVAAALADWRSLLKPGTPGLVVTHAPLYPPGLELPFEHYPTANFATAMEGHGSVYYGHVHEAHLIYHVGGVEFCNPGAISRGSLHEHNLTREVSVALWDSQTGHFTLTPVPHKPAAQVFRLDEIGAVKTAQLRLDGFLNSIGESRIQVTSIEAVQHEIRAMTLHPPVETIILDLLTWANA